MECAFKTTFLFMLCFSMQVAFGQVTVSVNGTVKSTVAKNSSFFCVPSGAFNELRWRKSDKSVTSVDEASLILQFTPILDEVRFDASVDASHYQFDSDNNNELKILNVTLEDEAKYWCDLTVGGQADAIDFIETSVGVPPPTDNSNSILMLGDDPFEDKGTLPVLAGQQDVSFVFIISGLKPNATGVMWSVEPSQGTNLQVVSTYSRQNATDPRLGDTVSTATLDIPKAKQDLTLKCITSYTWAETIDAEFSVTLKVTGGAGSIFYRLDVILACLALTAVYMFNHGI